MIHYIVHIADIHIRNIQLHDMYKKQFNRFINELKQLSENVWSKEKLTTDNIRIVIAGDFFHQKISITNEQLIIASQFITELLKFGKIILIPGNHDFLENNTDRVDSITPLVNLLNDDRITYYKTGGVYEDMNVNWVVYSLYEHNKRPDFELKENNKYIGLFHGPIQGMSTDIGYVFDDAYDKLNFRDLDIVLCGDIHKRSKTKIGKTEIIYCGSLIQQHFGEPVTKHGFGIYNVISDKYKFYDVENDSPFLHFKIKSINDIENNEEQLLNFE